MTGLNSYTSRRFPARQYPESDLATAPQIHVRARLPSVLGIPELDAPNPATIAREINNPSPASILDSFSNIQLVVFAVFEMDQDSLELDGPASYSELKGAETLRSAYEDSIAIYSAVYISVPELLPFAVLLRTVGACAEAALTQ